LTYVETYVMWSVARRRPSSSGRSQNTPH
jgi:hypothetical protein